MPTGASAGLEPDSFELWPWPYTQRLVTDSRVALIDDDRDRSVRFEQPHGPRSRAVARFRAS